MSTSDPYHHGDLRATLLRTAGEMLEAQGHASLSLREVARRAGVSHNAPYRHFPDKETLLAALAAEGFRLLGDAFESRPAREMGEAYIDFALAHPHRFRLMFGGVVRLDAYPELHGRDRRAYQALQKAFSHLGEHSRYAAAAAWSLVHGLSHLLLDGHFKEEDRARFVKAVLGAVRFTAPRTS